MWMASTASTVVIVVPLGIRKKRSSIKTFTLSALRMVGANSEWRERFWREILRWGNKLIVCSNCHRT